MPRACWSSIEQHARVADQHVDLRVERADLARARDHRIEIAELEHDGSRFALHARTRLLAALERARRADHVRAAQREHAHRLEADSGVAPRDDDGLAGHVDACRDVLGRRVGREVAARRVLRERFAEIRREREQRTALDESAAIQFVH